MAIFGVRLSQRDGVTCGPSAAIVGAALLDPAYGAPLLGAESSSEAARGWFDEEQRRMHKSLNRVWPRRLGATPAGIARALTQHSGRLGVRYQWRLYISPVTSLAPYRGKCDCLSDVRSDVENGWPVAMLVGNVVPRHWVLIVGITGTEFRCYEPSSGEVRPASIASIRSGRLTGMGFPRPFAFVRPKRRLPSTSATPRQPRQEVSRGKKNRDN